MNNKCREKMTDKKGSACPSSCERFVLLDIETSGLNETCDRVIRVSADKIIDGKLTERFFSFVAFPGELPREVIGLTGIRDEMLKSKPDLDAVMERFTQFRGDLPIYADNASFARKFLKKYGLDISERNIQENLDRAAVS